MARTKRSERRPSRPSCRKYMRLSAVSELSRRNSAESCRVRSTTRARRLPVPSASTEAALVNTAGAAMNVKIASGLSLIGVAMPEDSIRAGAPHKPMLLGCDFLQMILVSGSPTLYARGLLLLPSIGSCHPAFAEAPQEPSPERSRRGGRALPHRAPFLRVMGCMRAPRRTLELGKPESKDLGFPMK